jgi:phosphoenolpyruvate phosphomutase
MRASVSAMQAVCKTIKAEESLVNIEGKIASVAEVFRLQNMDELKQADKTYLPKKSA